jgi:hypothetical protein
MGLLGNSEKSVLIKPLKLLLNGNFISFYLNFKIESWLPETPYKIKSKLLITRSQISITNEHEYMLQQLLNF